MRITTPQVEMYVGRKRELEGAKEREINRPDMEGSRVIVR